MRWVTKAVLAAALTGCVAACSPTPEPEARLPTPPAPPERVAISETPCRQAIGEAASAKLVRRCIAVSPATRPPCNAANSCDLIQSEIDRSCALFRDGTKPTGCAG